MSNLQIFKSGLLSLLFLVGSLVRAQSLFEEVSLSNPEFTSNRSAHGVSVADYDNDGDDDFLLLNDDDDEPIKLFRNDGEFVFTEVAAIAGIRLSLKSRVAVWFDADNDGWLDLLIGSSSINHFFKNKGDGTFSDQSEASSLRTTSFNMAFMVGDLNGDQWLDVYCANLFEENQLFLNHGNTKFYNHIKGSGAEIGKLNSMGGTLVDYDQDGDLDIYCVYDQNEPNRLFKNDGKGLFTDVAKSLGVNFAGFGMGVDFADFNHDSKYDLYLSYYGRNGLLLQQPDGRFINTAKDAGVDDASMSWGVMSADFNNDTFSDIFLANSLNVSGINRLYYNQGDGTFVDQAANSSIATPSNSYGCAYADFNSDGQLDMVVANYGAIRVQVFENKQTTGNWFEVNLVGTQTNKYAVGARVVLVADGVTQVKEITAGSGYASQNTMRLHFGLKNASTVSSITIHWPNGTTESYPDVSINKRYLAIQGASLSLFDVSTYQAALKATNTLTAPNLTTPASTLSGIGYSVARIWNEALLDAIRSDLARPTIHARNLFHTSVALYDAWAVYDENATPYLLGRTVDGYHCPFEGVEIPESITSAQEEAMSYAAFRLLNHRFQNSPNAANSLSEFLKLFRVLGYDETYISTDYTSGSAAALGNYLAAKLIEFGLQDGSNEANGYANQFYTPKNEAFYPLNSGDSSITDPNHWQPLAFELFIDQSGNPVGQIPKFLSPEWGGVSPFSLNSGDLTIKKRDGNDYWVYHDPGTPPAIDITNAALSEEYKWNFSLVALWSSHLDPNDETLIDISPKSQGNIQQVPTTFTEYKDFYNELEGGDPGTGYSVNPATGLPYEPQLVKRGDYARVLAEFWADGPSSETPPGHWFTIINYVSDHPLFEKRFQGEGPILSDLEWDVKAYFMLGGAMHDVAIAAWGIKGYYDFIRPVSAIRYMVQKGQCTSTSLPNYDPAGIPLMEGFIELVKAGDALAGTQNEHVGEVKIRAWKGPHYIQDPTVDVAAVDWILGVDWSPYQRPSFVTPPFAGYISGHSTFSRAAAELLTKLTGNEYFPGGMSEFKANKNEFLVFEEGPTTDITLQWAKYKDASDQCSLSRIWGGIHPPADDIPGRIIGKEIGVEAFDYAVTFFSKSSTLSNGQLRANWSVYPNPVYDNSLFIQGATINDGSSIFLLDLSGKRIAQLGPETHLNENTIQINLPSLSTGVYVLQVGSTTRKIIVLN